jgi:hypothetical protein
LVWFGVVGLVVVVLRECDAMRSQGRYILGKVARAEGLGFRWGRINMGFV